MCERVFVRRGVGVKSGWSRVCRRWWMNVGRYGAGGDAGVDGVCRVDMMLWSCRTRVVVRCACREVLPGAGEDPWSVG